MNNNVYKMVLSAFLIAVGILIPSIFPKVVIPPMSFTLASHVAIMVAVFISPSVAVAVALGTTLGFLMSGLPMPVVVRALSHVIWAFAGALYLQKKPETLQSGFKTALFMLCLGIVHAVCEVIVVIPFYYGTTDVNQFIYMIFGLVGIGTLVQSCVDFVISVGVWKVLCKNMQIRKVSNVKAVNLIKQPVEA